MSTVQSYINELQAVQALIRRQSATLSHDDLQKLMALQCEAFVQKLDTVTALDIPSVDQLTQIVQGGPWLDPIKARLIMKFSTALVDAKPAGKAKQSRRDGQEISSFQNFAIACEAEVLKAEGVAFKVKVNTAIKMMKRMGLILPSEDSKAHMMSVLLASCPVWMREQTPRSVRDEYIKFTTLTRNTFKNTRNPGPMGYIVEWPDAPSALPQSQREIIFGAEEPVVLCDAETLAEARSYLSMRGNNSMLKQEQQTPVQAPTTMAMPMAMTLQQMQQLMLQQMQQFMAPGQQMMASGSSGARGSNEIALSFTNGAGANGANQQHQQHGYQSQPVQGQQLALEGPPQQLGLPGACAGAGQLQLALQNHGSSESLGGLTPQRPPSSDVQISPAEQAKKFLTAMQGGVPDEDDDDDATADVDDGAVKKRPAASKSSAKKTKMPDLRFKPKIDCEDSRTQYLFRCGIPVHAGGEPSVTFKYADHGGKKGAEKAAKKHLAEFEKLTSAPSIAAHVV